MLSKTVFKKHSEAVLSPDSKVDLSTAEDLISSGEMKLLDGMLAEALDCFQQAESLIEGSHPNLYYRQALALFEYGSEEGREQALLLASKKFKKAYSLDPNCFDVLCAWGNTLTLLGERLEEHHFFQEAKNKYEKALEIDQEATDLLWDYGVIWYHIGLHSEEAFDLQMAIQSFEKAALKAQDLPSAFWIDYGAATLLLSTKVHGVHHIIKAVNCFKHAVSQDQMCFESWSSLAEALQKLYEYSHDEDHFSQANQCFASAAKISPGEAEQWLEWGRFLLESAKRNSDVKRLRACLEKCHRAYACDCENSAILSIWAEALALLGQLTERLDLIYEAENKISEALELSEEDPDVLHAMGLCLFSFGSYFNDPDYYYQAIEKFQEALSIDRSCDHIWHQIAKTYLTVGTLDEEIEPIEQSLKFFQKALSLAPSSTRYIDCARALSKLGELSGDQNWLETSISYFELALQMQKNAVYLHPDWLFSYASTLDMLGDCHDDEKYYTQAIEIFSHVLMVDPDFHQTHHRLAQAFCHLGELIEEVDYFYRAVHHLRLALKHEEDNDLMILDWGIALVNIAQHTHVPTDVEPLMLDAEQKMLLSAKLGNAQAYYHLSCLYSLQNKLDRSIYFLMKASHFNRIPPLDELLGDEWLDNLRSTSSFHEFLAEHPHLSEEK